MSRPYIPIERSRIALQKFDVCNIYDDELPDIASTYPILTAKTAKFLPSPELCEYPRRQVFALAVVHLPKPSKHKARKLYPFYLHT